MTQKTIDTLVQDIYALFEKPHVVNEGNLDAFAKSIAQTLKNRLIEPPRTGARTELRMSKLGTPDRKLWFEFNTNLQENISSSGKIKFLYGDILESLLIFLTKEAGHTVEGEQGELFVAGVKGHRDCKIDGITTDIKSASNFSFKKFETGALLNDDPFGYIAQISSYVKADDSPYGAFFAINKETGELALLKVDKVDMIDPEQRVKHIQNNVLTRSSPPETKCYEPQPYGKSGNVALHKNCEYCPFKDLCWKEEGLRKFKYSDGVKNFVRISKLPEVEEVT